MMSCCGLCQPVKVKTEDGIEELELGESSEPKSPARMSIPKAAKLQKRRTTRLLNDELLPLGVSIELVRKLLTDHPDIERDKLTTLEINQRHILAETKDTNKAYIYKFVDTQDANNKAMVAPATVFISHAWRYEFMEVADVMEQHEADRPCSYFWFDLFANDQNNVANKDYEWFRETFADAIKAIGEVLLVMTPWDNPLPLTRAWCLFEISLTFEMAKSVRFIARLPHSQIEPLEAGVRADPKCILQALADIQAENADAGVLSDKEMIFTVIKRSKGGFHNINRKIKSYLREWYAKTLINLVEDGEGKDADLYGKVANVLTALGKTNKAMVYNKRRLAISQMNHGEDHQDTASSYINIGLQFFNQGQFSKALEYYEKALVIERAKFGDEHPRIGTTYNNIGAVHRSKGDLDKALEYFHKSLSIKRVTVCENHGETATAYNSIAGVLYSKGDLDKALEYYLKSLEIRLATVGENHSLTATAYNNIGTVCMRKKGYNKAFDYYQMALQINEATLGKYHAVTAVSYNNVGSAHDLGGNPDKALEFYQKSLTIKQATVGEKHLDTARSYNNVGAVYKKKKELDKALEYYHKALEIKRTVLGENHQETKIVYNNISKIYASKGLHEEAEKFARIK